MNALSGHCLVNTPFSPASRHAANYLDLALLLLLPELCPVASPFPLRQGRDQPAKITDVSSAPGKEPALFPRREKPARETRSGQAHHSHTCSLGSAAGSPPPAIPQGSEPGLAFSSRRLSSAFSGEAVRLRVESASPARRRADPGGGTVLFRALQQPRVAVGLAGLQVRLRESGRNPSLLGAVSFSAWGRASGREWKRSA